MYAPYPKNYHSDALSCAPVNTILVSMLTWQEFEDMQTLDEGIQLVKAWISGCRQHQNQLT